MICEYQEVWEECGRRRCDFLYVMISPHFADPCFLAGFGRGTQAQLYPDNPGFVVQQHW